MGGAGPALDLWRAHSKPRKPCAIEGARTLIKIVPPPAVKTILETNLGLSDEESAKRMVESLSEAEMMELLTYAARFRLADLYLGKKHLVDAPEDAAAEEDETAHYDARL